MIIKLYPITMCKECMILRKVKEHMSCDMTAVNMLQNVQLHGFSVQSRV